jgi:hypothetical protein
MAINDFYKECIRQRKTIAKNAKGESINTLSNTTIEGFVGSLSTVEQNIGGKLTGKSQYKFFTSDSGIMYNDLLVYGSYTYRVCSPPKDAGGLRHHYKMYVELIENVPVRVITMDIPVININVGLYTPTIS